MSGTRTNILVIATDQQRADAIGAYPGSQALTPHLDAIAAEGILFTQCVSNAPLCVPARASVATGLLPRQHGVWSNAAGANPAGPSHVRDVRDQGYTTAVIGKCHLYRDGPATAAGTHTRDGDANLAAWGFDERMEVNDPIGTRHAGCSYTDYLESRGWLAEHQAYIQEWVDQMRSGEVRPWDQRPSPVPEGEDIDSFIGSNVVRWLERHDGEQPFYLQAQFTGPHDPFDGPLAYRARYNAHELDPGIPEPPDDPVPGRIRALLRRNRTIGAATISERQRWRAAYLGNVSLIDDWIGEILAVLRHRDWLSNTWIVFISDHGEMLGDHALWGKTVFYRQSVTVPCILRPPGGITGRVSNALVELIDVPATLRDIAGAEPLDSAMGCSLCEHRTSDSTGKEAIVSDLFGQTMLRTRHHKLVFGTVDKRPHQLFDLEADPDERENRVFDTRHATELLDRWMEPFDALTDQTAFARYRDYVKQSGSLN